MTEGQLNYTTINHEARRKFGLSVNEYCVFDLVHHLATNPQNDQLGWCYAKKNTLADYLDLGRATVFRAIKKGIELGLLEKHPEQPSLVRATSLWYEAVIIKPKESQIETPSIKMRRIESQNDTPSSLKLRRTTITKILNKDINKTVNGDEKIFKKLPTLPIPQEQKEYLKNEILGFLKDKHSERFYLLVASKIPEGVIRQTLSEIKVDGADDPAKVFTYRMKRYALQQIRYDL